MTEIVVADIGGTHARFAVAEVDAGRVVALGPATVMRAADHASFDTAWAAFAAIAGVLPRAAAIAVACPVGGDVLQLTNNPWRIRPAALPVALGVDRLTLVNDFAAVGHAVAHAIAHSGADLAPLCGPAGALADGVVSIVGPGTGLGVAALVRAGDGYRVVATEGGHGDFAPLDAVEDAHLARLRAHFGRVSVERVVAGPALADWYATLAALDDGAIDGAAIDGGAIDGGAGRAVDDHALWAAALAGTDRLAAAALDRFCRCLGAVAGDIALIQGGFAGVVVAGGLGLRLAPHLPVSGFGARFVAKGRFAPLMAAIPVRILTHPQPGLFGAAAAFAQEHR